LIQGLAYYNNPRYPISLKELSGRVKEFVNVDFFPPPYPKSEEGLIWNSSRNISPGRGYPVSERRRNIAGANKRRELSGQRETSSSVSLLSEISFSFLLLLKTTEYK
jgi:hypothetical protein